MPASISLHSDILELGVLNPQVKGGADGICLFSLLFTLFLLVGGRRENRWQLLSIFLILLATFKIFLDLGWFVLTYIYIHIFSPHNAAYVKKETRVFSSSFKLVMEW